jgi:hypothetical protein
MACTSLHSSMAVRQLVQLLLSLEINNHSVNKSVSNYHKVVWKTFLHSAVNSYCQEFRINASNMDIYYGKAMTHSAAVDPDRK